MFQVDAKCSKSCKVKSFHSKFTLPTITFDKEVKTILNRPLSLQFMPLLKLSQILAFSLSVPWLSIPWFPLAGLTTGIWMLQSVLPDSTAYAYTYAVNVPIEWEANETYEGLTRRAEMTARATAQQSFDRDILITEVAITVLGTSGEIVVPLLLLQVSREDWRARPDPQYWATYYNSARELLQLSQPTVDTAPQ